MSSTPQEESDYRRRITRAIRRTHKLCPYCGKKPDVRHSPKLCKRVNRK